MPRYERILPLIGILLMGLGLILLVERINALTFAVPLPGGLEARVSIAWLILFFLLIVTAVGTESVQRDDEEPIVESEPQPRAFRLHPTSWIVPVLLTLTSFLFLRLLQASLARAIGLGIVGALLLAALVSQHYSHDERPQVRERSFLVLDLLVYPTAFFLYGAIYAQRVRSLVSATAIVLFTFLLALVLLERLAPQAQVRLYAAIVGLGVGEITWPLNYWVISGVVGGAFLLVIFYVLINPARHQLQGKPLRLDLEYLIVGLVALLLLGAYAFLRPNLRVLGM